MSVAIIVTMSAVGLGLSGCGGSPESAPTAPNVEGISPSTPSNSPSSDAEKSVRGNIVKSVTEPAGISDESGSQLVNFTIDAIAVDAPCTGPYVQAPENGHIVVLDVSIETAPELASDEGAYSTFDINPSMFKFIGANGTTFNGNLGSSGAYSCLPDEQQVGVNGGGVGPGEKVTGKIALDIPDTTGVLVFKSYLTSGTSGWEWKF